MYYKGVYWNAEKQRIRYTEKHKFEDYKNYQYIGSLTRVEFDLLIEVLFVKFEDSHISFGEVQSIYDELRYFCNRVKDITDNL